jgi:hypothetical protein
MHATRAVTGRRVAVLYGPAVGSIKAIQVNVDDVDEVHASGVTVRSTSLRSRSTLRPLLLLSDPDGQRLVGPRTGAVELTRRRGATSKQWDRKPFGRSQADRLRDCATDRLIGSHRGHG